MSVVAEPAYSRGRARFNLNQRETSASTNAVVEPALLCLVRLLAGDRWQTDEKAGGCDRHMVSCLAWGGPGKALAQSWQGRIPTSENACI